MTPATPAARFSGIVELLCRAVAARGARGALAAPLVILLWLRLRRAAARFCSLAARLEAGAPPPRPDNRRNRRRKSAPCTPRRFAWLLRPVPEAAAAASQLRHFLEDPEVTALIEGGAKNRFGRILRPLCRTIGITPPPALRAAAPNASKPNSITREIRRTRCKKQPSPPIFRARHPAAPPASIPAAAMKRHPRDPARAPPIFA